MSPRAPLPIAALALLACSPRPGAAPSPGAVVAEVDGAPITREQLERRAEAKLSRLRQEEYGIRREALEELVAERLLEKEAKARGTTVETLLAEAGARPPASDTARVEALYQAHKDRFPGLAKEEVVAQIRRVLAERASAEHQEAFRQELRQRATVRVLLEPPRASLAIPATAPALGPKGAPVTIVAFTDYQCPFCHRAQSTVDRLIEQYKDKVRLVHRDFPLEGHLQAFPAARAAYCAGEQGRFWEYYRSLMTVPGDFGQDDLKARAAGLGLRDGAFGACLASDRHDAVIRASVEDGLRAGVTGTPAYFINGRLVSGARPFEDFRQVIEEELARGG